jgi:DNA repair protein RadC
MIDVKAMSDSALLEIIGVTSKQTQGLGVLFGFTKERCSAIRETVVEYVIHPAIAASRELVTRAMAQALVGEDFSVNSPNEVRAYLKTLIGGLGHEVFVCIFLDSQQRVIATEELFRGTLTQTSVYPREIVKRALHHNACAVILAHNHPSGTPDPSGADEQLTRQLKSALAMVDVRVLDHFIVADTITSFAEKGLL